MPRIVLTQVSAGCWALCGPLPVTNGSPWLTAVKQLKTPRPPGGTPRPRSPRETHRHGSAHHRPALIIELHGGHERRLDQYAIEPPPKGRVSSRSHACATFQCCSSPLRTAPRRNPVLRLRHQVHRQEPGAKRQLRVGQDRARGQRVLVPAPAALIQRPALMAPVPGVLASGANEPVRPTPTKQRLTLRRSIPKARASSASWTTLPRQGRCGTRS